MVQTCGRCARVNPVNACYCYYDGAALMGASQAGPVGTQPFPQPFVFPSGQTCRNFDQLALACQADWANAGAALGDLERFLAGLGRSDLAMAARDAQKAADRDRGLDDFLSRLPGHAVAAPQLAVEPTAINLGRLKPGDDRSFELNLRNLGMRLVHGSIQVEGGLWLSVGKGRGGAQKLFQFGKELTLPVRIRGKHLRASHKPLSARLVIESNAGQVVVDVQAEVPVQAYPDGVLAGARSPRQVAEKAKANPKEAAKLFEAGQVARWYRENGWAYPVQGTPASGLAAVQQFFEALGLTPAPKVALITKSIMLRGQAGSQATATVEVRSTEKRPVWAEAVSDQPWLVVGKAKLDGRSATIPITTKPLPAAAGQSLRAKLKVRANGNQRFEVPVAVEMSGAIAATPTPPVQGNAFSYMDPAPTPPLLARKRPMDRRHFLVGGALAASLLALVAFDFLAANGPPPPPPGPPILNAEFGQVDPDPKIGLTFKEMNQRFGILMLGEKDPRNPQDNKRLTYASDGSTNNTCVKIDGFENLFGQNPGQWVRDRRGEIKGREEIIGRKWVSAWRYPQNVIVTQTVMIVPNQLTRKLDTCLVHYKIENKDARAHAVGLRFMLDTFIGANDGVPFSMPGRGGLMDTKIDIQNSKDIPVYVQALEVADLQQPGTAAQVGLKLPSEIRLNGNDPELEPMSRLVISRFPGNPEIRWDFVAQGKFWDMNDRSKGTENDSCVTMYWDYRSMPPGEVRTLAFTYGLGKITSVNRNTRLALTASSPIKVGDRFTVAAWVQDPLPNQKVRLHLPPGMSFASGVDAEKVVSQGQNRLGQASWVIEVDANAKVAEYQLTATTGTEREDLDVRVLKTYIGIFEVK